MDPLIYKEFITELAQKLQGKGAMNWWFYLICNSDVKALKKTFLDSTFIK